MVLPDGIQGGVGESTTLVIPGEREDPVSLYCAYEETSGIGVTWYRETSAINGNDREDICDCTTVVSRPGSNITFTNFGDDAAGVFGCWAITGPLTTTECNFEVMIAGKK